MKINVLGFNQSEIIKLSEVEQVRINATDLLVLRTTVDMIKSDRLQTKEVDNKVYTWINYNLLLEDLPLIATSVETIKKIMSKFVKCGLLDRIVKKQPNGGAFTYFRITEKLNNIEFTKTVEETNTESSDGLEISPIENKVEGKKEELYIPNEDTFEDSQISIIASEMTEPMTLKTSQTIKQHLTRNEISTLATRCINAKSKSTYLVNSYVIEGVYKLMR